MDPITIKLEHPVEHGSEIISELVFQRRMKAKDMRALPMKPDLGDLLNLVGRLTAQPPSVIDELDPADVMKAVEVVNGFLPGGPATGPPR